MLRDIIREAWADNPALFIAAVAGIPVAAFAAWAWVVVVAELLRAIGVRP